MNLMNVTGIYSVLPVSPQRLQVQGARAVLFLHSKAVVALAQVWLPWLELERLPATRLDGV